MDTPMRNGSAFRSSVAACALVMLAGCGIGVVGGTQRTGSPTMTNATVDSTPGVHHAGWLYTNKNHIFTADGHAWHGHGANIQDTASCGACAQDSDPNEVIRRIDTLVDGWGANFLRLTLESGQQSAVLTDPNYLAGLIAIVNHVGTKPGVYVMVSLWHDPTLNRQGWPTAQTEQVWLTLAQAFNNQPYVIFGIANEPQGNEDGEQDADVWNSMNAMVQVIRGAEAIAGSPQHIVSVQGTGEYARLLTYYENTPITAGGGTNIAYEVHVYDTANVFEERFVQPSAVIPVIIGEYGPVNGTMSNDDCATLMTMARAAEVPYLAWTFHMRCPPNLLEDTSAGTCGIGMTLQPTTWGQQVQADLQRPW